MFRVELPDDAKVLFAGAVELPADWRGSEDVSRAFGDGWIDAGATLALWVPSYVEPSEHKLIINAGHPGLNGVKLIKERDPFEFDPRLV